MFGCGTFGILFTPVYITIYFFLQFWYLYDLTENFFTYTEAESGTAAAEKYTLITVIIFSLRKLIIYNILAKEYPKYLQ